MCLLLFLLSVCVFQQAACSQCQTADGHTAWWAIVTIPRTTEMVVINSNDDTMEQLPHLWHDDSPLRITMETSSLANENTDFLTYVSDWGNVLLNQISAEYLTRGMIVYESGILRSSGFWMMHNNSMFPPNVNGTVIMNTSHPVWSSVTTENPRLDFTSFYFCISIDGDDHLSQIVDHWLVSNPSVFRSSLRHPVWQKKLERVDYPAGTFTYHGAVQALTECFYSASGEILYNCLHEYIDDKNRLSVITRVRGMQQHSVQICPNFITGSFEAGLPLWDVQYYKPSMKYAESGSIHTISLSTVCFGSDVTMDPHTTRVMACVDHPPLAQLFWSMGMYEDWSCSFHQMKLVRDGFGFNVGIKYQSLRERATDRAKKQEEEKMKTSVADETMDKEEDTAQEETPEHRRKIFRVERNQDLHELIYQNQNALLVIFHRKGCRYCDGLKPSVKKLAQSVWERYSMDVLMLDVMLEGLPVLLQSYWVPYIRCRLPIDESNEDNLGVWIPMKKLSFKPEAINEFIGSYCKRNATVNEPKESDSIEEKKKGRKTDKKPGEINKLNRKKRSPNTADPNNQPSPKEVLAEEDQNEQEANNENQCPQETVLTPAEKRKKKANVCAKNMESYYASENKDRVKCIGRITGHISDSDLAVQIDALDSCEPEKKSNCPKNNKQSLFFKVSESGCTILKASLVKVCKDKKEELYQAVCINGNKFKMPKDENDRYDFDNKKTFEAEGHLRELLKMEKLPEIVGEVGEDCNLELWMVSTGSPCYTHCSGACEKSGNMNIPNIVTDTKEKLNLESLTVRIAFAKQFENTKERDEQFKKAIEAMIGRGFKIYMCYFDDKWWEELQTPVCEAQSCKELKTQWSEMFQKTYSKLTDTWKLEVGQKPYCIYPNKNMEKEKSKSFFIMEEWKDYQEP